MPTTIRMRDFRQRCRAWDHCRLDIFTQRSSEQSETFCANVGSWFAREPRIRHRYRISSPKPKSVIRRQSREKTHPRIGRAVVTQNISLAVNSNLLVMETLSEAITRIEQILKTQVRPYPEYQGLIDVSGIGPVLGLTIMLETRDIERFAKVDNDASYCRCVGSKRTSNGKTKGCGNTKNGINIWLGSIWRRRISRCVTTLGSSVTTRERRPKPTGRSPSKRLRTSSPGAVTMFCAAGLNSMYKGHSHEIVNKRGYGLRW
uniref:Transposase IS116/IS110/IS902 family protein n=1 Tax=Candidatus Kentrum sp. TC TaxID=2126339 RepID=A0A450ZFA5_9GAMM|nr:MAG: Transposase IS116/IS110/IS902 family protein [Candidatus Kentron sp. TC]